MNKINYKMILIDTFLIWVFTLPTAFFGVFKQATGPMLSITSALITIYLILVNFNTKHLNTYKGISAVYLSYLVLLAAYKIGYWQFQFPIWYLIVGMCINSLLLLWILLDFIKRCNRRTKKYQHVSLISVALITYPIVMLISRAIKSTNSNSIAVSIMIVSLLIFSLIIDFGIRYFAIDDR